MSGPVDLAIVGAGPAGAAAAITAARAGLEVVVVDKATFPRDKTCGDGLTVWALRQLEHLGWDPSTAPSYRTVDAAWVGSPSRRLVEFALPAGPGAFAAVVRRTELDAALVDLARASGAEVLEGASCVGATPTGDGVRLMLSGDRTVDARVVIGADGMWSSLRQHLGGPSGYLGDWHAFRQYVRDVGPLAAERLYAWFEPDFLPGYAWSFPLGDGGANVGFGILRSSTWRVGAMKTLWPELLARPHLRAVLGPDATPEGPHRAWPIPCRLGAVPASIGRALFVGDAVAAADPLTGEGIGQALATGSWAAEAILAAPVADLDRVGDRYAERLAADLGPDHRMSWWLNSALSHRKGARTAIRVASLSEWTRTNFARWLFEDYPRGIALTPGRWRRGILTGPGAFAPDPPRTTGAADG